MIKEEGKFKDKKSKTIYIENNLLRDTQKDVKYEVKTVTSGEGVKMQGW